MTAVDHLPWRYDHWKRHPEKLVPRDEYVIVSIRETSDGVRFTQYLVRDSDIPALCEQTAEPTMDTKWALELLITACPESFSEHGLVPYSIDSVVALHSYWHIPYSYIPSFGSTVELSMAFSPLLHDSNWKGFFQGLGGVITTTYNSATRQTFALCLGKDDLDRIVTRVQQAQNFASNPFLTSVILLSINEQPVRNMGIQISRDCREMEATMGYDSEDDEIDLDRMPESSQIPQRLNRLLSRVANLEYINYLMLTAQNRLEGQIERLPGEHCLSTCKELREQLVYTQESLENISSLARRSKDLLQAMVQTVNAKLQQRDNQLNHRYGADMRLITAITLIFLPGTFVATFFSTTFWDFSPNNNGTKVTYWVYLYFVVTIGLTLLVLVVWRRFIALKRLTTKIARLGRRFPLLGRLIREKKVNDEESGKKGD